MPQSRDPSGTGRAPQTQSPLQRKGKQAKTRLNSGEGKMPSKHRFDHADVDGPRDNTKVSSLESTYRKY